MLRHRPLESFIRMTCMGCAIQNIVRSASSHALPNALNPNFLNLELYALRAIKGSMVPPGYNWFVVWVDKRNVSPARARVFGCTKLVIAAAAYTKTSPCPMWHVGSAGR